MRFTDKKRNERYFEHDESFVFEELDCVTTDNGRFYTNPKGSRYPSVTTILSRGTDQSWKDAWIARVGEEEAKRVSRQATIKGESVHDMAEKFMRNYDDYAKGHMPGNVSAFAPLKKVLTDHVGKIGGLEVPLYSDSLRMAGRVDCFAEWDGEWAIIDFKTSKRVKKKEDITSYFIQETAYAQMIWERTGVVVRKIVTVMTVEENGLALVFEERPKNWLKELYDMRQRVTESHGI